MNNLEKPDLGDQAAAAIANAQWRQTLSESETLYRCLVESALVGVFLIRDGKIVYVNPRVCEITGYAREELIGRSAKDLVQTRECEEAPAAQARHGIERIRRKDGQLIEVEFQSRWMEFAGDQTLVGTVLNVTAERQTGRLRHRLGQIGRDILAAPDLPKILKDVVEAITVHSPFQTAGISIYDRPVAAHETEGYHIKEVFVAGLPQAQIAQLSRQALSGQFLPHHKVFAHARQIGAMSYFVSPHELPEIVTAGVPLPATHPDSTWGPYDTLFVFLYSEDRLLGRICVANPIHGQMPAPEDLEPLEILANMAALALEKVQRMADLQTALRQVEHINRFLRTLNEARRVPEMLQIVIQWGLELLPQAQGGSFLVLDEAESAYEFRAAVGRDLTTLQRVRLPKRETIRAWRLDRGPQILTRSDQAANKMRRELTQELGEPPASTVTLPITSGEQIIGVLNFNHFDKEGVFDHEDIRAIQGLLPEITLALARVRDHERLREQTLRDPLTGIYNRRYLNELLTHELEQARHYGHPFAFLMIDFDNFFAVNDRFGHLMGDQVLREIAQILRRAVRASDTVIRYGGDEFLVVLLKAAQPDAERVAHRLEERCEAWLQEFQRRHGKLRLSISIGLALWTPESQKEISAVLDEADQFMYRRKRTRAKSRLRS